MYQSLLQISLAAILLPAGSYIFYLNTLRRCLEMKKPIKTNTMPKTLLTSILDTATFTSPSLNRLKLSSAKVENVVNPPRKPIKMKLLTFGEKFSISEKPHRKPIVRQPDRFTARGIAEKGSQCTAACEKEKFYHIFLSFPNHRIKNSRLCFRKDVLFFKGGSSLPGWHTS
jgi:hypothetical protein